ncbi:MAG: hypothetical protein QF441_12290 [Bacteriovoracaceae bacterium]|jgi:hypothetical protein|nr:hypothetical protein [Halobacteriovoraceae bacterium]MDP7321385.1 hypothetical protein [Bacteriovoracaceae bacterium]
MNTLLTYEDQRHFKQWLELNLNSISWEGRYLDEFHQVWDHVFSPDISLEAQFALLDNIEKILTQGPMISWFKWIKKKLIVYVFIYKNLKINEISYEVGVSSSLVSLILRDFFIERFPHLEDQLNHKFHIGNILSSNLELSFDELANAYSFERDIRGSLDEDIMTGLEVTLYSDWEKLNQYFEDQAKEKIGRNFLTDRKILSKQIKFLQEVMLLFALGALLIFAIKVGNKTYEDYLVEKISLFSPNFFWLDKNISFKGESSVSDDDLEVQLKELNELEKIGAREVFEDFEQTTRYEVESDVVLTSVESLPKDFTVAGLELSNYEEIKKGGYRNNRYGRRKAYRVMMTSVDPESIRNKLVKILGEYNVRQVDNVKPGTQIPGGMYFNLYVPRTSLKEFLAKVSSYEEQSTILESKTVFGGPANMDKVFIWIKSI